MTPQTIAEDTPKGFEAVVSERRSIRGFLPDPVPSDLLLKVFGTAQLAPSNCNVQPWHVHIVSGQSADDMRAALSTAALSGSGPRPDLELTGPYPDVYRRRQIDAAVTLFSATGVARDDKSGRQQSMMRNFRFFDAPHAAFILMPGWAGYREAADCGMYLQTLMLTMTANGLASCAQGALSHYGEVVRRQLGVGDDMNVLMGLAFGFEDRLHPANAAVTTRADLADAVTFHVAGATDNAYKRNS